MVHSVGYDVVAGCCLLGVARRTWCMLAGVPLLAWSGPSPPVPLLPKQAWGEGGSDIQELFDKRSMSSCWIATRQMPGFLDNARHSSMRIAGNTLDRITDRAGGD
ncbi:MAG: hypothetical protein U1A77_03260 [Pirellulales bacterium]